MAKITLSGQLEECVIGALLRGALPFELVKKDEFSKVGKAVYESLDRMRRGSEPPYQVQAVVSMAVDALGADADDVRPFLKRASLVAAGKEVGEIVRTLRDRQTILDVLEAATDQLEKCTLDRTTLLRALEEGERANEVKALCEYVGEKLPEAPTGVPLKSLPKLTDVTGGLFGLWAIAGEPAVGKSTLAIQIAIHYAQVHPVLYYDFENGLAVQLHRLGTALGSVNALKEKTERFYMRDSIRWLEADLASIKPPALIVVDSIQKVPTSVEFRRNSIDKWVHRFEALKKRGYSVLLLSEKDRANYGTAKMSGYKESGEIEYSADIGIQLLAEDEDVVSMHVVKNRHRPDKGHIADLTRSKSFWFKEEQAMERDDDSDL